MLNVSCFIDALLEEENNTWTTWKRRQSFFAGRDAFESDWVPCPRCVAGADHYHDMSNDFNGLTHPEKIGTRPFEPAGHLLTFKPNKKNYQCSGKFAYGGRTALCDRDEEHLHLDKANKMIIHVTGGIGKPVSNDEAGKIAGRLLKDRNE